jgi:hypothetical protein
MPLASSAADSIVVFLGSAERKRERMRRPLLIIFLFLSTLGSSGCVTPPPSSDGFAEVSQPRSFDLPQRLVVVQKVAPLATSAAEVDLAPGLYTAVQENAEGTLFRGPPGCVMYEHTRGFRVVSGGLWLPKDKAKRVRMYVYQATDEQDYRDRASAIAATGGRDVPGSTAGTATPQLGVVVTGPDGKPATSNSAIAGGQAGGAIVNALIGWEVERHRGKPAFLWEVDSPEVAALRARLN